MRSPGRFAAAAAAGPALTALFFVGVSTCVTRIEIVGAVRTACIGTVGSPGSAPPRRGSALTSGRA
ncbi:hypothetical protein CH279_18920 [Rhodococcus sp. 06-412-2B]|nr:hypothetical protein CH279_18920 [Rhodococcus sp. 06-412-2B]